MRFLRLALVRLLEFTVDVLGWGLILALGVRVWCAVSPSAGINRLDAVAALKQWIDPEIALAASWVGARWPMSAGPGRYFPLALALVAWGAVMLARRGLGRVRFHALESSEAVRAARSVSRAERAEESAITTGSGITRERMRQQVREMERKLETARRQSCAFLNIEVVGAARIKAGEPLANISASFQAYEELLRGIFQNRAAWKQSWTPEGVVVCFHQLSSAVRAAQDVLHALPRFNSGESKLRMAFRVRCGIAEGEVPLFDDTNLAAFSDHVIDLAACLQKDARPNSLCISEEVWMSLGDKAGFYLTGRAVEGRNVFEWSAEPPPQAGPASDRAAVPLPPSARPPVPAGGMAPASLPEHSAVAAASLPPQAIGRYQIVGEMGRGAMGVVYRALDPRIARAVALKVILPQGLSADEMRAQKERFYREARAAGRLQHPGIVAIHDIGEDAAGSPFLVMELVQGATLDKAMIPGGLVHGSTFAQRLALAVEIADALDYAHRSGVIHRDIKPANVLLTADGHAKLADFGIAKLAGAQTTLTGRGLGTPAFVSPEQLTGGHTDGRSDIFSFGVMLYWLFTGERPFKADTMTAANYQVMHSTPLPARQLNPALPEALDAILTRCLAKDPGARFQTAAELAAALKSLRHENITV